MVHCVQSRPASTVHSVLRLIAVQNVPCWLACFVHNGPPSIKYQYTLSSFLSRSLFSLWSCNQVKAYSCWNLVPKGYEITFRSMCGEWPRYGKMYCSMHVLHCRNPEPVVGKLLLKSNCVTLLPLLLKETSSFKSVTHFSL